MNVYSDKTVFKVMTMIPDVISVTPSLSEVH